MPGARRQLGRPSGGLWGKMLAPRDGGLRLCRGRGANSGARSAGSGVKSWRLGTVAQGFAGSEAPTRAARRPIPTRKVGAPERWHKALPGVRRQLGRPSGRAQKTAEPEALLVTPPALPRFPDVRLPCRFGCESRIRSPGSVSSRRCFSSRRKTGFP